MTCSACGKCCKIMTFIIPERPRSKSDNEYYSYRGITFEELTPKEQRQFPNAEREIIPCRCKYLGEDNLCTIWETRPDICDRTKRGGVNIYKPPGCTGED